MTVNDATALADHMRTGRVSVADVISAHGSIADRRDEHLRCLVVNNFEAAVQTSSADLDPQAPFYGVPLVVKDHGAEARGDPTYSGLHAASQARWRAPCDSQFVSRIRQAGFVLCGRSATPEFATLPSTESSWFGATRNPLSPSASAGGSSGGSAAAVAAGIAPIATGGDGGGSIRIPAALCGIVGFKPSRGVMPCGPLGSLWAGLATYGPLTRSVRDAQRFLSAVGRAIPHSSIATSQQRAGVVIESPLGGSVEETCLQAVNVAANVLAEAGWDVESRQPPAFREFDDVVRQIGRIASVATLAEYTEWQYRLHRAISLDELEPLNAAIIRSASRRTALELYDALDYVRSWSRRLSDWWASPSGCDILLTPTMPLASYPNGYFQDADIARVTERIRHVCAFTLPFNASGQPAVSVPVNTGPEVPLSIQVIGPRNGDHLVLDAAATIEAANPSPPRCTGATW